MMDTVERCKDCGKEEQGYGSLLNSEGYCFTCSLSHYNDLLSKYNLLKDEVKDLKNSNYALNLLVGIYERENVELKNKIKEIENVEV